MASGLTRYMQPGDENQSPITMEDLMAASNPASTIPVPQALKEQDLAQLYDQEMRDAANREQEGASRLQEYIQDYSAKPRGIDWTAAAAFFDNPRLMQAAQSMKPVSEEEKAQNIMNMQSRLASQLGDVSNSRLKALGQQLASKQSAERLAQTDAIRREQARLEAERQKALDKYRQQQLRLQEMQLNSTNENRQAARDLSLSQKEDARFDKDIQAMEKRIGDVAPGVATKLQNLDQLIPGGIEGDEQAEVPGAGVGKFLIPDWAMNDQSSDVQQNARGLAADLIKLQSGAAASDKEVDRKLKELGMAPGSKSSTFRSGLKRLKNQFVNELKNKEAAFDPKVKQVYQERGGLTHEKILEIGKKAPSEAELKLKRLQELRQKAGQ